MHCFLHLVHTVPTHDIIAERVHYQVDFLVPRVQLSSHCFLFFQSQSPPVVQTVLLSWFTLTLPPFPLNYSVILLYLTCFGSTLKLKSWEFK